MFNSKASTKINLSCHLTTLKTPNLQVGVSNTAMEDIN